MDSKHMKRLPDFEMFDRIELRVVPRFKTSGLSGDTWRQHVEIEFWFKGNLVRSEGVSTMAVACAMLGGFYYRACDEGMSDAAMAAEKGACMQPSCTNRATVHYVLKKEFSRQGEAIEQNEFSTYFREFCDAHARRGDCSREDCDSNYDMEKAVRDGD